MSEPSSHDKSDNILAETNDASVTVVQNAFIVPPSRRSKQLMSVNDEAGLPVRDAVTTAKHAVHFPRYLSGKERSGVEFDTGRYLFCGFYFPHFGHFILESLSRLWAYEAYKNQIDGLIFLRDSRKIPDPNVYQEIFDLLGVTHPIKFVQSPLQCAKLIVPQQGIGMGAFASGTDPLRSFIKEKFSQVAAPSKDCEKIYISRSGYQMRRGGMLCENILESNLVAQGYKIFHPQSENLKTQIATYRGAKMIVSPDNSALHLAAFVGTPDQKVAIVLRRKYGAVDLFPQLTAFSGREPLIIDAIEKIWAQEDRVPSTWGHYAEHSFETIHQQLLENGFIQDDLPWRNIGPWLVKRAIAELENRNGGALTAISPNFNPPLMQAHYFT